MKHIDTERFESYRVEFEGFTYTTTRFPDILALWKGRAGHGRFIGIEPSGYEAILDTK